MNTEGLTKLREYIRKDKPKALRKDFVPKEPLTWGWLLPYLLGLEDMTWERWEYWAQTKVAGRLLPTPIPQIEWAAEHGESSHGWKMLDRCLNAVTKYGEWQGWSAAGHFEYFLDWLLFGFGDARQRELPKEHSDQEGASNRLYQLFNLEPLLAYPHDYFGDMMAMSGFGKHSGFYPTPMCVSDMNARMLLAGEDCRAKSVMDPCVGTGRLLLAASNHSMRLYGNDINETVIKACLVNGYLYAPWLVKSLACLDDAAAEPPPAPPANQPVIELAPATPQLELCLT